MSDVLAVRKNGESYIPEYVSSLNADECIGCGRCFKVCGQGVFDLVDRADLATDDDDDDYEDEGTMVMTLANDGNCIGCKACGRVCPKGCHAFAAQAA
ncbi:MAG: ferredoxin III, nif-specific [bacterium]|nr:ferredoxin III, nif-specific [bacterium]